MSGLRMRSAISPEGWWSDSGAIMRMQHPADTILAALLVRFELKKTLTNLLFIAINHNCVNKIVYFCSMETKLEILKGIHPGFVLERELKKRHLGKGKFAISVGEFPQTLTAITKGKRRMNIPLALKIEKALAMEEGYFMVLQVYYDIEQAKKKEKKEEKNRLQPDLSLLRTVLFWDTDIKKIDWEKQKKAVIQRVFERGNEEEKKEITRFYGSETIEVFLANK